MALVPALVARNSTLRARSAKKVPPLPSGVLVIFIFVIGCLPLASCAVQSNLPQGVSVGAELANASDLNRTVVWAVPVLSNLASLSRETAESQSEPLAGTPCRPTLWSQEGSALL